MGITTKEYHEGYQQGYKEAKEEFQNTLCKYQKITEIVERFKNQYDHTTSMDLMMEIREVLEDGNDD